MITLSDKQCTHPTSMTSSPSPHSSQMRTRHASMSACLKHETKEWHETRNDVFKAGLVTSTGIWIDELERRFRHTAGKATVLDDTQHTPKRPHYLHRNLPRKSSPYGLRSKPLLLSKPLLPLLQQEDSRKRWTISMTACAACAIAQSSSSTLSFNHS